MTTSLVLRYNMYPQNSFAGHAECRVEPDGRLRYSLFFMPFSGEEHVEFVADPANPEEMRGVRQLHLQMQ